MAYKRVGDSRHPCFTPIMLAIASDYIAGMAIPARHVPELPNLYVMCYLVYIETEERRKKDKE